MIAIDDKTRSAAMFLSSVLFRAFLLGSGLLLLFGLPSMFLPNEVYATASNMDDLPLPEYKVILFGSMMIFKTLVIAFFLVPAVAIRWAVKLAK